MRLTPDRNSQRPKPTSFVTYFGYVMVVIYLALGLTLLFTDMLAGGFPATQRKLLGGLLLIYALYRAYSVTGHLRKPRNHDQE